MVLSWRADTPEASSRVFTGTGDVKLFMFYFENVLMRGKDLQEKSYELLAHLDGEAFQFFFERFTTAGVLRDEAKEFENVKNAFFDRFQKKEEPQDVIREATDASLDPERLVESMDRVDALYSRAGFNEEAKFGFLRMAAMKIPQVATFAMYRGASDYPALKKAIRDFDSGMRAFHSVTKYDGMSSTEILDVQQEKDKRLLVRPDARVKNMEVKIDTLADQLADLTLLMKKGQASSSTQVNADRLCSYCNKPGHGANRCTENPHRDTKCPNCGKMGHSQATCWSKRRSQEKKKEPKDQGESRVSFLGQDDGSDASSGERSAEEREGEHGVNVIMEAENPEDDCLMALKRGADGQPLPKNHKSGEQGAPIGSLLNPETKPVEARKPVTPSKKKKSKKKVTKKTSKQKKKDPNTDCPEKYDVVSALTSAPSGITFGQLWRGDATSARKELDRIFGKGKLKLGVVADVKGAVEENEEEEKCLAVTKVSMYGLDVYALMDSGATPNVVSPRVVERLSLIPQATNKVLTVANGEKSGVKGKLQDVPVSFDGMTAGLDFVVLENLPFDIVIGRPTLKRLGGVLDFKAEEVRLDYREKIVKLPMISEYARPRDLGSGTDSEDFTSSSEATDVSSGGEEEGNEGDQVEYVVMIQSDAESSTGNHAEDQGATIRQELEEKLAHLPKGNAEHLTKILSGSGIIAASLHDLRPANVPVRHSFELKNDEPIYSGGRRLPPKHNKIVKEEIDRMLEAGIVTPTSSAWSFPVVIASKKDGSSRFCVDYRVLNQRMKADRFPLPKIQEIFDELIGGKVFTTLDLFSGYWQIRLSEACKEKTTFVCRFGTFQFEVMPFGLMNAPSTFQRMMTAILSDLPFVRVYLDDVVIFSPDLEGHMGHIREVVARIAKHGLKLKIKKCEFARDEVELLGHIIDKDGVRVDPAKVKVIQDTPRPTNTTELRSFLGIAGYYRRFIRSFADISSALHAMTSSKISFSWDKEMDKAFHLLKISLSSPPVLAFPNFEKPFGVETDASSVAVGAVLTQKDDDGKTHPVQFASRTMTVAERKYSACEREALAVIFALRKFRLYLLSTEPFILMTDQQALKSAFARKDIHGRLARWLDFLAEYEFEFQYRKGSLNKAADFLSRIKHGEEVIEGTDEGDLLCVLSEEISEAASFDLEEELVEVVTHLSGKCSTGRNKQEKAGIRRRSKNHVLWQGRLYRRGKKGLTVVVRRGDRRGVVKALHDEMGHWDTRATQKLVTERFWWPRVHADIAHYVKTCDSCQRMGAVGSYRTNLQVRQGGLFDVFSIDFAGPFPVTAEKNCYLLVCVEHLTGWPIVKPTKRATAAVVVQFINEEVIPPFGAPGMIISDNAKCFTAPMLSDFMKKHGVEWRTVLAYAPMSNGRAERMVGTIKRSIGRLINDGGISWDQAVVKTVFGYRRRPLAEGISPFQLLYGVSPRLMPTEKDGGNGIMTLSHRRMEILAALGPRAQRAQGGKTSAKRRLPGKEYAVGDLVLVAHGSALTNMKWPSFKSKFYGPCKVVSAKHPRYILRSSTGKHTRVAIHARRLVRYFQRSN